MALLPGIAHLGRGGDAEQPQGVSEPSLPGRLVATVGVPQQPGDPL